MKKYTQVIYIIILITQIIFITKYILIIGLNPLFQEHITIMSIVMTIQNQNKKEKVVMMNIDITLVVMMIIV